MLDRATQIDEAHFYLRFTIYHLLTERLRDVLMNDQPLAAAILKDDCVPAYELHWRYVLRFGNQTKSQRSDREVAAARDLDVVVRRDRQTAESRRDIVLEIVVILLPACVFNWIDIKENQICVFGISRRWVVGIKSAPCRVILFDNAIEIRRALLLRNGGKTKDANAQNCKQYSFH